MAKIEIPLKKDYAGAFKYWVDTNTENGVCTIPEYICKGIVEMLGKQPDVPDTNVGDLISRRTAIDAAALSAAEWDGMYVQDINGRIRKALEQLPPAQPERRWIPCSERLPELDEDGYSQKVLACYGNCSGCDILEYRATEGIGKWYIGDMDDSPEDIGVMVLAWMPLPEPYKECGTERRTDETD